MKQQRRTRSIVSQPPSKDKRWKLVDVTMRRNGYAGQALIETLHTVQDCFGYLDEDSLRHVAFSLRLPPSRVFGVATFYHLFTLRPPGAHACVVCTGTACYINDARELLDGIKSEYSIRPGETTSDSSLSVLSARCLGACRLAPAAVVDGRILGKQSPRNLLAAIKEVV